VRGCAVFGPDFPLFLHEHQFRPHFLARLKNCLHHVAPRRTIVLEHQHALCGGVGSLGLRPRPVLLTSMAPSRCLLCRFSGRAAESPGRVAVYLARRASKDDMGANSSLFLFALLNGTGVFLRCVVLRAQTAEGAVAVASELRVTPFGAPDALRVSALWDKDGGHMLSSGDPHS